MKNLSGKSLQALAAIVTSFLVFAFAYLAWNGFISDSEIWSVTIAKNFREEWFQPWVFSRILFYGPLALATAPFETATSIFMAAKVLLLLNGTLIIFLSYRLARGLGRNQGAGVVTPWLAVILLLSNTGFLNQGYRIRSDLFSCSLVLLALNATLLARSRLSPRQLLYWVLPFLATPKAAIHVFPAITLLRNPADRKRILAIFLLGFFLATLIYPSAIPFFLNTYTNPEMGSGFFSPQRFIYLGRILIHNGLIVCLFGFRFVTWIIRLKVDGFESESQRLLHRRFGYFTAGSLVLLILSPEKVPFYVASFLPIFSVFASLLVDDILAILDRAVPEQRRGAHKKLLWLAIPLTIATVSLRAGINWNAFRQNNSASVQLGLIRAIETYLNKYPKATYYDVVGLVPQRAKIRLFAGPNDPEANKNSFRMLKIYKPDIIFPVLKMRYFEPGFGDFLKESYFSIGTNALARWSRLPAPLRLPLKKGQDLALLTEQMKKQAGVSSLPEFTVLIGVKGKPDEVKQVRESDLFNRKITGSNTRLLAVSPFTKIDHGADIFSSIIRFDWDWTGATEIEEIPAIDLKPHD